MKKWLSSSGVLTLLLVQLSVQLSYGQGPSILFYREGDIYSINSDGTNLIRVTEGENPVWSPDRSSMLVTRQNRSMWTVSSDGSVSVSLGEAHDYAWSRDGQQVIFMRYNGIYLINKDGSRERQLVPTGASRPRWSPNNDSLVVYYQKRPDSVGAYDIFFLNVISGESRLVRALMHIPNVRDPFSPNGTRLLVSDCVDGGPCVKILNLATDEVIPIGPSGQAGADRPAWSPDGNRIVFDVFDGMGGLHLASSDGQVVTELVPGRSEAAPGGAAWSPNGDMIVFQMVNWSETQSNQIYLINADGTGMRRLTEGSWPVWSPIRSGIPGGTSIQMLPWGLLKSQ